MRSDGRRNLMRSGPPVRPESDVFRRDSFSKLTIQVLFQIDVEVVFLFDDVLNRGRPDKPWIGLFARGELVCGDVPIQEAMDKLVGGAHVYWFFGEHGRCQGFVDPKAPHDCGTHVLEDFVADLHCIFLNLGASSKPCSRPSLARLAKR